MVTKIQLQETTKQLEKNKTKTYDKVIQDLLAQQTDMKEMFGFTKKKPLKFSRKDELRFHEL